MFEIGLSRGRQKSHLGLRGDNSLVFLFMLQLVETMAQRKRMAYNVSRDILDEETLDEIAEKADSNPSLCDKLKKSLR